MTEGHQQEENAPKEPESLAEETVQAEEVGVEDEQAESPNQEPLPQGELEVQAEMASLRQELEDTRAKETEYLDGWQRARAELANARKRFQREQAQAYANARADLLVRLLPIVDDFRRAFETLPDDLATDNPLADTLAADTLSARAWVEGVRLIHAKFQGLLDQEGVVSIETVGQEFDPLLHQAVTHEPSDEVPEGHVIGEMQTGYRMDERVLRPSMVRVSAGPPPEPEPEPEPEPDTESREGGEAPDTESL